MPRRSGAVTMRQLSRQTAAIIDRVRENDAQVLITRHGIPVATIQPLEIEPWARQPRRAVPEIEEEEVDLDGFELTELMRELLRDADHGWLDVNRTGRRLEVGAIETMPATGGLELKGLTTKTLTGRYELTRTGRRVVEKLFGAEESQ